MSEEQRRAIFQSFHSLIMSSADNGDQFASSTLPILLEFVPLHLVYLTRI